MREGINTRHGGIITADFKKEERQRRRAQSKQALREDKEPGKTYKYSEWYW